MTAVPGDAATGESAFAEGLHLMRNPDGQGGFLRGIEMIETAAEEGHPDALARAALFEAMGIGRPQNWDRAFDRLQQAAEHGSADAQRQLALLADPNRPPDAPASGDEDWATLRASIALERLLRHGQRISLSTAPRIRVIEAFASPAECAYLIDRARTLLKPATVVKKSGEQSTAAGRTNSSAGFVEDAMDVVVEVIRARISAATGVPPWIFEVTQVLHYSVGQEFSTHCDYLDPANPAHLPRIQAGGQRIATFLIFLNEGFKGGETEFQKIGLRYRGQTGDAIFWANLDTANRPDPLTLHAGLPPTSGEKWILSQWIRDRAQGQMKQQ